MLFRAAAPGPDTSAKGRWPNTVAADVVKPAAAASRTPRVSGQTSTALEPATCSANFHDEDAVLRDQPHQVMKPSFVDQMLIVGEVRKLKTSAPRSPRCSARQYDQRIAKALKLRGEHQVDEHDCNPSVTVRSRPCMRICRDSRMIDHNTRPLRGCGSRFEHAKPFLLGHARLHSAKDAHRIALLKAIQ